MEKAVLLNSLNLAGSAFNTSSPLNKTEPAVGSINLVKHLTNVDLPEPDNPITTKTSPGATSKETFFTAAVLPVFSLNSERERSASDELTIFSGLSPKTFHKFLTEMAEELLCEFIYIHPFSSNQLDAAGLRFCQTCLASWYSANPIGPNSRPKPDCLNPPHSA